MMILNQFCSLSVFVWITCIVEVSTSVSLNAAQAVC